MSLGEFARVVSNLKGITEYIYLHVLGEPLSHPFLPTFIEYAKACGFKVALTTNGTLLRAKGEQLLLSSPYKINISLHSFEGESDEAREEYISSCLDFAERASEQGILTVLRLWNLADGVACDGSADLLNSTALATIRSRFGEPESISARGGRIRDKLHFEFGERFEWPDINASDLGEAVFCHGLGDHFAILVDGTVVPCCLDADGAVPLGNIFCEDVRAILRSPRALAIKEGFAQKKASEELCRRCAYARRFKI
jgi:radical SAM protein with 4Fe4S-binding SPASM domain